LLPILKELIDIEKLRYIAFSHVESDECGALNDWLRVAHNAVPISSKVGLATVEDLSDKPIQIV